MLRIGLSCLSLFLLSACATVERPIVYEAADFDGKAVGEAGVSFLIWGGIDIDLLVPEVVVAFDGGPAQAVAEMESRLRSLLVGSRAPVVRGKRVSVSQTLRHFKDLHAQVDSAFVSEHITVKADAYGVLTIEVGDPELLASQLEQVSSSYLLVLGGLRLEPRLFTGVRTTQGVVLSGQVLVWDRAQKSLVWHGYVSGLAHFAKFGGRNDAFFLSSVDGLVVDLMRALE